MNHSIVATSAKSAVAVVLFADGVELICDRTTASSRRHGKAWAGWCRPPKADM